MAWPCPQVSPSGFIFCGRTVVCFNGRHAPWTLMRAPSAPAAQIKQYRRQEDVFSQVLWQMYAAREAGVPTVPYRLPAVTQEDGKMEARDRVQGREGGDEWEWWWREDTSPEASSLAFVPLITRIKQNMAAPRERGWHQGEKTQNNAEGGERGSKRGMTNHPSSFG